MTDNAPDETRGEGKEYPPNEGDNNEKSSSEIAADTNSLAGDFEKINLSGNEKAEGSLEDGDRSDGQNGIWSSGSESDADRAAASAEAMEASPESAIEEVPLSTRLPDTEIPDPFFPQDLEDLSHDDPVRLRDLCLDAWKQIRDLPKNRKVSDDQLLGIYHDLGQDQVRFEAGSDPLLDASLEEEAFFKHARRFNDKISRFGIWPRGLDFSTTTTAFAREGEQQSFQHITVRRRELGTPLIKAVQEGCLTKAELRQIRYRLLGMQCSFFADTTKHREAFGNIAGDSLDAHEKSLKRFHRFMHGQLDPCHIFVLNVNKGIIIEVSGWDRAGLFDWTETAKKHRETMSQNARNTEDNKELCALYSSWARLYDLDDAAVDQAADSQVDLEAMYETADLLNRARASEVSPG